MAVSTNNGQVKRNCDKLMKINPENPTKIGLFDFHYRELDQEYLIKYPEYSKQIFWINTPEILNENPPNHISHGQFNNPYFSITMSDSLHLPQKLSKLEWNMPYLHWKDVDY